MLLRINRPLLCGMILGREGGLPAIMVEDIIDVARAAGRVIMDVYSTDPKVTHMNPASFLCCRASLQL